MIVPSRWLAVLCMLAVSVMVSADIVKLKDGTVIEGTVIPQKENYWIKTPDGKSRLVPMADVASITGSRATPTAAPSVGSAATAPSIASASFTATKRKADSYDIPLAAVTLWQKFIDSNPSAADLAAANLELEQWKKLADEGAERIKGKWVGGEERKALLAKVDALVEEADSLVQQNKTILAVKKLEEGLKAYPNSYPLSFLLGRIALDANNYDDSTRYYEQCVRLRPDAPEALNNLGVLLWRKGNRERSIQLLYQAATHEDSQPLAYNLLKATSLLPEGMRRDYRFKPAVESAAVLAAKYRLNPRQDWERTPWMIMHLSPESASSGLPPVIMASGTGFIIRDDGLILTNHHVVAKAEALLVLLDGGIQKSGEVVAVDEAQDLALIRVKLDKKLPTIMLAKADTPAEGIACFVIGFPLLDRMGATIKITQGIVSGKGGPETPADIITDAKVNPGNSGGPLVDKYGQVIGIVSMKSRTTAMEDSYGMAISTGRIRKFLANNKITLTFTDPGTTALAPEEVAARIKPATVCILTTK